MSNAIDALFSGMAKAPVFGKGSYMSKGTYEVDIKSLKVETSKDPKKAKVNMFIAEFLIASTTDEKAHPVGASRSTVNLFSNQYAFADISKLMMALLGYDPSKKENNENPEVRELAEAFAAAQCGGEEARKTLGEAFKEGMFNGKRLRLECIESDCTPSVKNPSGKFTNHVWSPLPGATVYGA